MINKKKELLGLSPAEMEEFAIEVGEPVFRGRQLYKWIYQKETSSFYDMTDLPRPLRAELDRKAVISIPRVLKQRVSSDGTRKFLIEMNDKKKVETVVIPMSNDKKPKYSLCISTQVGCPVGCSFCATGASGFQRDLEAFEIVGQVLGSRRELAKRLKTGNEGLISNVVYMGMGEPMFNYDESIKSIHILNEHKGINIGQRHITISTSGDVKGIEKLTNENMQITLAISLHACDNDLRNQLIPLNRKYPLEKLMEAVENYIKITNRRVTFEYIMLDEVNIAKKDADNMVKLVRPLLANVNLIPYNEVDGLKYKKPVLTKIMNFYNYLQDKGINVTIREEKGADIEAACGQLAAKKER